ncbi:MAG: hypothetical protein JXA28_12505 [Bacteroidetes bacterium]|nr:hypothetical protein [Bacteroidota bacterium]
MHRTLRRTLILVLVLCASGSAGEALAQSSFRLKRTKKETTPINAQLLAGYNGMSNPADIIQDMFEHTNLTSLGGLAVGIQGMIELDTVLTQIWVGAEVNYSRLAQRWLLEDPDVHFVGEAESQVDAVERLWGLGGNLLFAIGPVARLTLVFGPGLQYQDARIDTNLPIEGNLSEDRIIPTALGGVNLQLLVYDHGSIDANFRGVWGFGDYGSFQFQSLLGFTFNF